MTTTKKALGAHLRTLTGPLRMMVRIGVERSMTEAQANDYSRARRNAARASHNQTLDEVHAEALPDDAARTPAPEGIAAARECPGHGPIRETYYCDGRCQHRIHADGRPDMTNTRNIAPGTEVRATLPRPQVLIDHDRKTVHIIHADGTVDRPEYDAYLAGPVRDPEVSGRWAGIESTGDERALRRELDAAHEQASAENEARSGKLTCTTCSRAVRIGSSGPEHVEPATHVNGIHVPTLPGDAPNGMTSINGVAFPSDSDIELSLVSGRTVVGKIGHMFPNGFVLSTPDGDVQIGSSSITGVRPITSAADWLLADQRASDRPRLAFCRTGQHSCTPVVTLTFDGGSRRLHWCGEHAGDADAYRPDSDEAARDEARWTLGTITDVHEQAIADDATRTTIAWRNDSGETFTRSIVDPTEVRQTIRAIETHEGLTQILTRAEVRAWLVLRGCSDADLAPSVNDLFGRTEDELDDMYEASHGSMA